MKKILIYTLLLFVLAFVLATIFHFVYKNGGAGVREWSCDGREIRITCVSHFPAKLPDTCYYLCLGKPYISNDLDDVLDGLDFYQDSEGFRNIYR
jgi:hypothetical protein